MGKIFEAYKKYYDVLNESKVENAQTLIESCNTHLNAIKDKFNQIVGTNWEEKGKKFVFSIFNQMTNNVKELTTFINDNLLIACQKADQLYLKTVEIKNSEENLESKQSILNDYVNDIGYLKNELSREKLKIENSVGEKDTSRIGPLQGQISNLQNLINTITSEIENITNNLNRLCEEANLLISEILQLDGADVDIIANTLVGITTEIYDLDKIVQDFNYFEKHLFLGAPYTKWERYGNGFLVTLANGLSFTVYQQTDANNYNTKNWHNHLRNNIGLNFNGNNPLGGGCSGFALASALSYHLNLPHLDPGIGFSGGGMWGGIQSVLNGDEVLELVDPKTGRLNHYTINSDYKLGDYSGERFGFSTSQEFKDDIHNTFEQGGSVILNATASGFASPDGQHFVTLIGEDENGYVIIADSMYEGRGAYSLNSSEYNPDLPYAANNCPPYMKFNKETGEPFKVDDLVDYLIDNSDGTNSYCAITSANLEFVEEAKIGKQYQSQYEEIVASHQKENS